MIDPKLADEAGRLSALHRYELLDTPQEPTFDRITSLVKTVLDVPIAVVSLIDADRQWFKSCTGFASQQTPRNISFCTYTIQARTPMLVPDAALDPRFANSPLVTGDPFIRSYLGIPLSTPDGYNVGSLCAIDTKPRTFTPDQIDVLKSFAALVMDEMELRRIAQTDHLTGAATRRGFCLEIERAISRFVRHGETSALLMLDIDHFKIVNDTWGHAAGDVVLRVLGAKLSALLRPVDSLGRLGGEEFSILLANISLDQAVRTTERLRQAIESCTIPHDPPLHVTASFGVAPIQAESLTAEGWLAAADQALYAAKRGGRNRVCCTSDSKPIAEPALRR